MKRIAGFFMGLVTVMVSTTATAQTPTPDEIKAIAKEAAIYALPMVMMYDITYEFNIDKDSGQYKAPINVLKNESNVFTPADTAVVTPNSDTPYSLITMDLRAEPMVLCVPAFDKDRYYSVQLVSQYTFNFGYIGSRATGNEAGCYAVAGPHWSGETPEGIDKLFVSGTDFALAIYRTQLFDAADIDNVRAIQKTYEVKPLSAFLGTDAPPAPPAVDWPKIGKQSGSAHPFDHLAFLLQFAPPIGPASVEVPLREKFASIGIEAGEPFPSVALTDADKAAIAEGAEAGVAAARARAANIGKDVNGWMVSEGLIGDRAFIDGDWTQRAAAALAGILGNDAAEALYPLAKQDAAGQPLDGSKADYTLTFPNDGLPPVNAFWSVTMYDGKTQLLIDNPINRYLVNAPMLPDLTRNEDGSLTLYIQKDEPADAAHKANWLPAPDGPIYMVMRLYWPKEAALDGSWAPPAIEPVVK